MCCRAPAAFDSPGPAVDAVFDIEQFEEMYEVSGRKCLTVAAVGEAGTKNLLRFFGSFERYRQVAVTDPLLLTYRHNNAF